MKRDPRVDPQPGDWLRKKYKGQYFESRGYNERSVFEVEGGRVVYAGPNVCTPEISIAAWRRWAKDATVMFAAD